MCDFSRVAAVRAELAMPPVCYHRIEAGAFHATAADSVRTAPKAITALIIQLYIVRLPVYIISMSGVKDKENCVPAFAVF